MSENFNVSLKACLQIVGTTLRIVTICCIKSPLTVHLVFRDSWYQRHIEVFTRFQAAASVTERNGGKSKLEKNMYIEMKSDLKFYLAKSDMYVFRLFIPEFGSGS